jgi:hypothetical protein
MRFSFGRKCGFGSIQKPVWNAQNSADIFGNGIAQNLGHLLPSGSRKDSRKFLASANWHLRKLL